ncbi:ABC transporter permease subunit [Vaginisenegalia massiliensis]|uniref:ABC transporter permease subunit n=1 Tax=Vaginisenegalia massiliensis TaxID=2058294 RepID=UPI000F5289F6|nr:ABC transporter permease subunit [Vaginisenegalia massiliensis]
MTLIQHEFKQHLQLTLIWAISLALFVAMIITIYPQMADQMNQMSSLMSGLGMLTSALNIDIKSMTTLLGYYAMEVENMVGIGGGLFAAYLGARLLSKEEALHTAEFLFTQPIKRHQVYWQKLVALVGLILLLNGLIVCCSWSLIHITHQTVPLDRFVQFHLAIVCLHLDLALLCYGLSAMSQHFTPSIGLGLSFGLYFLSILINLWDKLDVARYVTPFQFAYAADIIKQGSLDIPLLTSNFALALTILLIGLVCFCRRDLAA